MRLLERVDQLFSSQVAARRNNHSFRLSACQAAVIYIALFLVQTEKKKKKALSEKFLFRFGLKAAKQKCSVTAERSRYQVGICLPAAVR